MIGPEIRVTVERIESGQVRIGIEAPGDYLVLRSELAGERTDWDRRTRP
jgi:carbon storage regulator CsrA